MPASIAITLSRNASLMSSCIPANPFETLGHVSSRARLRRLNLFLIGGKARHAVTMPGRRRVI
jgi:hypothetical protein